jgi:hypothetical protein
VLLRHHDGGGLLLHRAAPAEKIEPIIWSRKYAELPEEEKRRYHGWKDFRLWWLLFVAIILGIYAFFFWLQFIRR